MLLLYVLGPAFNLPSIDAECLAAIALLHLHLPAEAWTLTPAHTQTHTLPHLTNDSSPEPPLSGYAAIAAHIAPSTNLTPQQLADSTALTAHLQTHARPLLDASLYLSSENYPCTRSAYTRILPWHANYTLPPARRALAKTRTAHLGIDAVDVDAADEQTGGSVDTGVGKPGDEFEKPAKDRASVLLGKKGQTLGGLLRARGNGAVFRLHALAEGCLEPLGDILVMRRGEREGAFLLGTREPAAVDCLAYGYLALMLWAEVPQGWLGRLLRGRFGALGAWVEGLHGRLGLGGTDVGEVMGLAQCRGEEEVVALRKSCGMVLPWTAPERSGVLEVGYTVASDILGRIPMLHPQTQIVPAKERPVALWQRYLPIVLATTVSSLAAAGYIAFSTGWAVWPTGEQVQIFGRKRISDYGHLGAALAGVSILGNQAQAAGDSGNTGVDDPVGINAVGVEVRVDEN